MSARRYIRALSRAVTWTFYRVDTRGAPPATGGVLLVANHPNALLDPAVVWATSGRDVRFRAKEPLFRIPVLGPMLRAGGAIPVYRAIDAADMSKNSAMFSAAGAALAAGDAVCIFPEGTSHSSGRLEPLRTGAARIALTAAGAGVEADIVPVGLNFDRKSAFRSRATVVYGPPVRVRAGESVRALTDRIADAMRALMIEADPIVDAAIVARIDRLLAAARPETMQQNRVDRRRRIAAGIERLRAAHPEWYGEIAERVRTYDARLARFGLRDRDLSGSVPAGVAARFAVREGLIAIALAPILAVGLLMFWLPYRVTDLIAARGSLDEQATTKVVAGIAVYGVWVALVGWLAWRAFGADGALLALAALPAAAFVALFAVERETAVLRATWAWLAVRRASPSARARLGRTRDEIVEVLDRVGEWLEAAEVAEATEIQRRSGVGGDERSGT
jgi:glycerol-3-phosphate O-acyltransferase/dihydroxyacetone phosphate acyltransferase